MIYLVNGNDVSFPRGASPESPYREPRNDQLLPSPHDAGHDNRVGHVLRTDPDGSRWEVIAGGFRNQFDIAFNADGEMFTFDADMEWDVGLPWYRPTRINHVVSGGEYGWRWGTGKWPSYYADSLPATLEMGLGSPTGLVFGYTSRFPSVYQQALFVADWQNGRILTIHMRPRGASYDCRSELFLEGAPLNVCDMTIGPDGALYFITGGRGSQSGLYRVTCVDLTDESQSTDEDTERSRVAARQARDLRRRLESFHTRRHPQAVEIAWPQLGNPDEWIRYAARLAVERQPLAVWRDRALVEQDPLVAVTALLAMSRVGDKSDQAELLAALARLKLPELDHSTLLTALRVYALSFIRQGRPDDHTARQIAARLNAIYPHASTRVNAELCELLVYFAAPDVIDKTLALLEQTPSQEAQIHYALALSRLSRGWSPASRKQMLHWFAQSGRFRGGRLLPTALTNIRDDFLATLTDDERTVLAEEITALSQPRAEAHDFANRPLVRRWKMDDLADLVGGVRGRSHSSARQALATAGCLRCHRIGEEGTSIGPDLTHVGRRFDARTLLESIVLPSKVIDPKYRHDTYELDNGKVVAGRPVSVSRDQLVIETDPLAATTEKIQRQSIVASYPSRISPMPTGLLDTLTKEEIQDLLAYLISGGNSEDAVFKASGR
jgi:putative heme-binding domain-containing protein